MMHNKQLRNLISFICILLTLSFIVFTFSGCNSSSNEEILTYIWNSDRFTLNGNEYILVENNDDWLWKDTDRMTKIGIIQRPGDWSFFAEFYVYASNEEPPIYLYVGDSGSNVCYMLKDHILPSKYTATFSHIDFVSKKIENIYFDKAVSMTDIISYENTLSVETCEGKYYCGSVFYYSENEILYLWTDIYVINEEFYILLDNVYYPIVMPEILDRLNALK